MQQGFLILHPSIVMVKLMELVTKDFLSNVNKADKIIFRFTLNATGNVTQEIKIYSDYRINFHAVLVVKPDIKLNL